MSGAAYIVKFGYCLFQLIDRILYPDDHRVRINPEGNRAYVDARILPGFGGTTSATDLRDLVSRHAGLQHAWLLPGEGAPSHDRNQPLGCLIRVESQARLLTKRS
jgi:hypothetical protein